MHARKFAEIKRCVYPSIDPYHLENFTGYSKPSASLQKRTFIVQMRGGTEKIKNQPQTPRFYVNNEMTTIFDHRLMGTNPFGLRLVLLRSTYGQKMSSKSSGHFGYFPRESGPCLAEGIKSYPLF